MSTKLETGEVKDLLARAGDGDPAAVEALMMLYRERLKGMVRTRINQKLQSRLDESDIVQDAFVDVVRRLDEYLEAPQVPFYIWVRGIVGVKLKQVHRDHLQAQRRDARRERSLTMGDEDGANSGVIALELLGGFTSPSNAVAKMEMKEQLRAALEQLDARDREVIAMRHVEQMSTMETAAALGLSKAGAGNRYLRAISRLKKVLAEQPGYVDLPGFLD